MRFVSCYILVFGLSVVLQGCDFSTGDPVPPDEPRFTWHEIDHLSTEKVHWITEVCNEIAGDLAYHCKVILLSAADPQHITKHDVQVLEVMQTKAIYSRAPYWWKPGNKVQYHKSLVHVRFFSGHDAFVQASEFVHKRHRDQCAMHEAKSSPDVEKARLLKSCDNCSRTNFMKARSTLTYSKVEAIATHWANEHPLYSVGNNDCQRFSADMIGHFTECTNIKAFQSSGARNLGNWWFCFLHSRQEEIQRFSIPIIPIFGLGLLYYFLFIFAFMCLLVPTVGLIIAFTVCITDCICGKGFTPLKQDASTDTETGRSNEGSTKSGFCEGIRRVAEGTRSILLSISMVLSIVLLYIVTWYPWDCQNS